MFVQGLAKIGAVKSVGVATPENPREILLGDPYWTEGNRFVMVVSEEPVAMDKIEFFIWEFRTKGGREVIEKLQKESAFRNSK
jgi:hypothetical protein